MMKKITITILLIIIVSSTMLFASGNKETQTNNNINNKEEQAMAKYHDIDAQTVKKMLDEKEEFYFIDVRTQEEYDYSHIPNSKNIPLDVISSRASAEFSSKDSKIILYCRSGARAGVAANELVAKGYTNVYNLGGIISWPYDVTK